MALNRYGDATLLWVVPAERHRPAGTVEVVMPGLLRGYMDRFAPDENAHNLSFDGWLQVCTNALVLSRLQKSLKHGTAAATGPGPGTTDAPQEAGADDA